jgi:REP-associated tyrosine transposase
MATFRRSITPGATYFFTLVTYRRRPALIDPPFYRALKQSIRAVRETHPFSIEAFVLLPDHLHCIWRLPEGDSGYALRWSMIKRLTSQQTRGLAAPALSESRSKRGELGLWQRRFWEHRIRDERDFERHVEYIHWNPVKHGHARAVADWPYSSFHKFVRDGIYPAGWGGSGEAAGPEGDYGEPA